MLLCGLLHHLLCCLYFCGDAANCCCQVLDAAAHAGSVLQQQLCRCHDAVVELVNLCSTAPAQIEGAARCATAVQQQQTQRDEWATAMADTLAH